MNVYIHTTLIDYSSDWFKKSHSTTELCDKVFTAKSKKALHFVLKNLLMMEMVSKGKKMCIDWCYHSFQPVHISTCECDKQKDDFPT